MKKAVLHDLFLMEIQDIYDAENQLLMALPNMAEAATDSDLKAGFEKHLRQTEEHVSRLEELAAMLEMDLEGEGCEAMAGLIAEGDEVIEADMDVRVKDLALIGAAEKVEFYEHTGYEMAELLAKEMGHDEAAKLLKQTKEEEKETAGILQAAAKNILKQIED